MKLKEWSEKIGVKYLTAYRWFKAGTLPVKAYQTDSGTIIVQEDEFLLEDNMEYINSNNNSPNDAMSVFLKKTVEFSKNNATVEEFAAYVISNFQLKLNTTHEPKYSKVKPKPEDIQNHFKQFIKPKGEKPKPNMFMAEPENLENLAAQADSLTTKELVDEINKIGGLDISNEINNVPEVQDLLKDLSSALSTPSGALQVRTLANSVTEGIVTRTVDSTPQLNYTNSTGSYAFGDSSLSSYNSSASINSSYLASNPTSDFKPTTNEIHSSNEVLKSVTVKAKRGRKPSKITGNE